jgi:ribonuclease T
VSRRREATPAGGEKYFSVDIEASGPIPSAYSMLSIGACPVDDIEEGFYAELQPINDRFVQEALEVSGLSLESLYKHGIDPLEAMISFRDWVDGVSADQRPVFVGFNASFDWAFVNWYFHSFLGANPFGIGGVDMKSYYMGFSGCEWAQTTSSKLPDWLQPSRTQTHNALDDARAQAEIFGKLLDASRERRRADS